MSSNKSRELFKKYAAAVVYVNVELPNGDQSIGTAFHVGNGVFITARHVVDGTKILEIANTTSYWEQDDSGGVLHGKEGRYRNISPASW